MRTAWRWAIALVLLTGCLGLASTAMAEETAETPETPGAEAAQEAEEEKAYSRAVEIEGLGVFPYYAQNDPRWAKTLYEPRDSSGFRMMKAAGCGPTSLAMAIAHQLPAERLPELLNHAADPKRGFPFCACSVGAYHHYGDHEILSPTEPEDFAAYLPVILGCYAVGNNDHWLKLRKADTSGTSISLFDMVSQAYGLRYKACGEWEEAREALESGASVITTVTKGIFTSTSHYMCIAGVADGWVYLLDPLMREAYPGDKNGWVEVVEPGVIRAREENLGHLWLYRYYVIWKEESAFAN